MRLYCHVATILAGVLLAGCFTGVESTPKIGASEVKHQNAAGNTTEKLYLQDVLPQEFGDWIRGKEFYVADKRVGMIFSSGSAQASLDKGDVILYDHAEEVRSPVGTATDLYFSTPDGKYPLIYRINASIDELKNRDEVEIPFAVDVALVEAVKGYLKGNNYYIITSRWNDDAGDPVTRVKYILVTITDVVPGTHDFPVMVKFVPHYKGLAPDKEYSAMMTVGTSQRASRNFDTLFALNNPRNRYPMITDENWTAIIENRVREGMTREEARLALGAPIDVDRGHDYSSVYERWVYDGGVYLIFQDGVLQRFRR